MVFSSLLFLFKFLPATLLIYYIVPKKLKNAVLLVASLIFYSWGEPKYFPLMIACILVNYFAALLMDRHREKRAVLQELFQSLLHKLMTGEIRATDLNLSALPTAAAA